MIRVKRIYSHESRCKGKCFLVDRLLPRGIKKEALRIDGWLKEVAPSQELRLWFGHEAKKWRAFWSRYFAELDAKPNSWQRLVKAAAKGDVTLLFAASDVNYTNAIALKEYLELKLKKKWVTELFKFFLHPTFQMRILPFILV